MMCKNPFIKRNPKNKLEVILSEDAREYGSPFPCGQCLHCRINKSREWTNRLLLEQRTSAESYFVTLTYDEEHLPPDSHLQPRDLTNFIKRYRKYNDHTKLRYFAVGEYGDLSWRPHYHLAIFSSDGMHWDKLQSIWGLGFTQLGDISKDSARYLTGYVTKKITKNYRENLGNRPSEFMRCSKHNGGLGHGAILQIAEKLKKHPRLKAETLRELQQGKQSLPLGRYLTKKLADAIGITPQEFQVQYWDYQQENFEKNLTSQNLYYSNVITEFEQERLSQEAKHKIHKKRKSL